MNLPSVKIDHTKLEHLNADQKDSLFKLLDEFADVFVEKPGLCSEGVHEIHVTTDFKPRRLSKAATRGVFWVFEHPRNFREKLDTQKQVYY